MFTTYCPVHGAEVLIWPSGIDEIVNRDGGIAVAYHCTCGHHGVWVTRGAHSSVDSPGASTTTDARSPALSANR